MRGKSHGVGGTNGRARLTINLETGIFYDCVTEAAKSIGMKPVKLMDRLNGKVKNTTNFAYA